MAPKPVSTSPRLGRKLALICLIAALSAAGTGHAALLWEDEEEQQKLELNTALKWTGLFSHAPDDPFSFPTVMRRSAYSGAGST
jgi:hypothetical protein